MILIEGLGAQGPEVDRLEKLIGKPAPPLRLVVATRPRRFRDCLISDWGRSIKPPYQCYLQPLFPLRVRSGNNPYTDTRYLLGYS